ncbi:FAD-dependent oxidoreductase [Oleiharenicola lentus]|uniref:FAD-dependent oxidoreductase n=1 Tax=Oleiharenicola lentus TaxID=2508720 RepID=UPI003F667056
MTRKPLLWTLLALAFSFAFRPAALAVENAPAYDVVVFGGTSAGVAAAVAAGRGGSKVLLVESGYLIGGLTTGGLTKTDIGKGETIGGLAREFYDRVLKHYTKAYGADSQQVKETGGGYFFETKVALQIYYEMLAEAGVVVRTKEQLESVEVKDKRIVAFTTRHYESGKFTRFSGKHFVDGSYEGDLMAQAGVLYRVGREARAEYNEPLAGITSGPEEYIGKSDQRVQAFNIRGTLSIRDDNRVAIPKPKNYYREAHANLIDTVNKLKLTRLDQLFTDTQRWAMINGKCDPNKADFPGVNFAYSDGDYEQRARITAKVQDYWLSLWYMLQNDPALPEDFKADARRWGLPKDEFVESGHVTPQVYVRVARRMLGRYFLTQTDLLYERYKPDAICMGSYNMDAHAIQIIQTDAGPKEEGHFNDSSDAYEIPYRSLLPYGVDNLVVVAAVSASHVAYSSIRMEPVFMMLGQAGGIAIDLARKDGAKVQDVSIAKLQAQLTKDGVPLKAPFRPVVAIKVKTKDPQPGQPVEFEIVSRHVQSPLKIISWNFDGSGEVQATGQTARYTFNQATPAKVMVLATDEKRLVTLPARLEFSLGEDATLDREVHYYQAKLDGRWNRARGPEVEYRQRVALSDQDVGGEPMKAEFTTTLPKSGRYRVALAFPSGGNRASNVPVTVTHAGGSTELKLNQKKKPGPFAFQPIGEFQFTAGQPVTVKISNAGVDGMVLIDTVRWIWLGN